MLKFTIDIQGTSRCKNNQLIHLIIMISGLHLDVSLFLITTQKENNLIIKIHNLAGYLVNVIDVPPPVQIKPSFNHLNQVIA